MLIDEQSPSRGLIIRQRGHEISSQRSRGISSSPTNSNQKRVEAGDEVDVPDEKSVGVFDELSLLILCNNDLIGDFLDHCLGRDVDVILLERRHGVITV